MIPFKSLVLLGLICLSVPLSAQIVWSEDFETCAGGCPDSIQWKQFLSNEIPDNMSNDFWVEERFQLSSGNWHAYDYTTGIQSRMGGRWRRETEASNDYLGANPVRSSGWDRLNFLTNKFQISKKSLLFLEYRADKISPENQSVEIYWTNGIQTTNFNKVWDISANLNFSNTWTHQTIVLDQGYNADRQLLLQYGALYAEHIFDIDNMVVYEIPSPVAEYKLEGNGNDDSGNNLQANPGGGLLFGPDRHNANGNGYQFRGAQELVIPDNSLLDFTDAFSIVAWIRINPEQTGIGTIAGKAAGATSNYAFGVEEENGKYKLRMELSDGTNTTVLKGNADLNADQWYHVACIFGKPNMTLVIDGEVDASGTFNHSLLNNPEALRLGRESWHSSIRRYFDGYIDDVAIYDQALYWKYVRYKRNQEKPANPPTINGVAEFDAASSARIQVESTYDFSGNFMVETQFRSYGFTSANEVIISKGTDTWNIRRDGFTSRLIFDVPGVGSVSSQTNVNDLKWHHVAGVYNGTQLKLYIDGYLEAQTAVSGTPATNNQNVTLGAHPTAGDVEFYGQIDETRIWSLERSAAQIKAEINNDLTGLEPGLVSYWKFDEGSGTYANDLVGYNGVEMLNNAALSTATVHVDINEAPTGLSLSSTTINEGLPAETKVGDFTATDANASDTFIYQLVAGTGDVDNNKFHIVGGSLLSSQVFDHETQSLLRVRVRTTDNRGLSFERAVSIVVMNQNDEPTDITLSNASVPENAQVVVGQFSTVDQDVSDNFSYSLINGTGDDDNDLFQITGDELLVKTALDYEAQQQYSIRIQTQDNGGVTFAKAFTIMARDTTENRGGKFNSSKLQIDQDGVQGVGTVSLWVYLNTLSTGNAQTIINRHANVGSQKGWNLVETGGKFRVQAKSTGDPRNLNSTTTVAIKKWYHVAITFDYDDSDKIKLYVNGVEDGEVSLDGFIFLTKEIWLGESPDPWWNNLDGVMDELKIWNKVLTREQILCEMGNFSLLETDGALTYLKMDGANPGGSITDHSPGGTSVFTNNGVSWITSFDQPNVAPTGISLSNTLVVENSANGTGVGNLTATDPNNHVSGYTYELVPGAGDDFNDHFEVDGTALKTTMGLDYETNTSASIRLRVTDPQCHSFEQSLTLSVQNLEEDPTITPGEDIFVVKDSGLQTYSGWATNISDGDDGSMPLMIVLTAEDPDLFSTQPGIDAGTGDLTFESASGKTGLTKINGQISEVIEDPLLMIPIPGATTNFSFNIKITEFNTAPTVANPIEDQNLVEGFSTQTIDLTNVFTDAEGHTLLLSAISSDPSIVSVSLSDTDLTITEVGNGTTSITVTADDDNGGKTDDVFVVNVGIAPNNAPVVANALDDLILAQGFGSKEINLEAVFSDADEDVLAISAQSSNGSVVTVSVVNEVLTLTEIGNGTALVSVTADDGTGGMVTDEFSVTVNEEGTITTIDNQWKMVNVYPNPFQESFVLELPEREIHEIGIYDLSGNLIFQLLKPMENSLSIEATHLRSGIYLIRLNTASGYISQRIVKR